ncbi:MAG: MarR family transcriptional regulator [Gammaproteobacteria bacterium]|nr:MarR family transcriptional regulator [Gammaproteobacteria bacterium]
MNEEHIHDLLERLGSLLDGDRRSAGQQFGLLPVQLEALRYLARCNRFSDSPIAVSEYLGLTKGTVSQTLKAIEAKGFVSRKPDTQDRRVIHLKLTAKGRRALSKTVPSDLVKTSVKEFSDSNRKGLVTGLERLLGAAQTAAGQRTFGACPTCTHLQKGKQGSHCAYFDVALKADELNQICREHEPAKKGR